MGQTEERGADASDLGEQMKYRSYTYDDSCSGMETDTGSIARSTLAQARYCPAKHESLACPNDSSNESSVPTVPVDRGPIPFSGSSRGIIKQRFTETNPIWFDPGHPIVVFNQDQISSILRIVADESARASFEMLNSVVQRASRLNLKSPSRPQQRNRTRSTTDPGTDTDVGRQ